LKRDRQSLVWFRHPAQGQDPKPPTTAAHVSLSSIFNCQRTDHTQTHDHRLSALGLSRSSVACAALFGLTQGRTSLRQRRAALVVERFIGPTHTKSQQPFLQICHFFRTCGICRASTPENRASRAITADIQMDSEAPDSGIGWPKCSTAVCAAAKTLAIPPLRRSRPVICRQGARSRYSPADLPPRTSAMGALMQPS
jgi:hypothetical protein